MNGRVSLLVGWTIATSLAATGCGSDEKPRSGHLLDGADPQQSDAETTRREKMQAVTVLREDGQTEEWSAAKLEGNIAFFECSGQPGFGTPGFGAGVCDVLVSSGDCSQNDCCREQECGSIRDRCVGEMLLAAASPSPIPVTFRGVGPDNVTQFEYEVLPQSASSNFAIAARAYQLYAGLTQRIGRMLGGFDVGVAQNSSGALFLSEAPTTCNPARMKINNAHEVFASAFVDAYFRTKEAADLVTENALAISDAELSSTPTLTLGADRASAWRAAAAALLTQTQYNPVGFSLPEFPAGVALPGHLKDGFCNSAEAVGPVKTALNILRQAAISTEDVLAMEEFQLPVHGQPGTLQPNYTVSIEDLVDGTGPSVPGGSVRERLIDMWHVEIPPNISLPEYYGLKIEDFAEARKYLGQEIRAFNRSTAMTLETVFTNGGGGNSFARYAGTAGPPPERDAAYYTAIARTITRPPAGSGEFTAIPERNPSPSNGPPILSYKASFHYAGSPLADVIDDAQSWATYVLTRQEFAQDPVMAEGIFNRLGLIVSNEDRPGRIIQCHGYEVASDISLTVNGYTPADGLRVVSGEDGLECATRGGVEGGPCNVEDYVVTDFTADWPPDPGFSVATTHQSLFITAPPSALEPALPALPTRWYLIQPRRLGQASYGAGDYKVLTGFVPQYTLPPEPRTPREMCMDIPIVPAALEPVGRLLAPNPEWCTNSGTTCAGARFDERLPLEDELSDDNDNVESSWKHYLALARQAANEADLLGQEYLNSGTTLVEEEQAAEQRAIGEIETLQEICGTAIDPSVLLNLLSGTAGDLGEMDGGPCTANMPEDRTCIGGRSIKNWIGSTSDPELRKLGDCIGRFNDRIPFIHLGDRALCLWREEDGSICRLQHEGFQCPDLAKTDANGFFCDVPQGTIPILVPEEDGLGFFDTLTTMPPPPTPSLCDNIRELRGSPGGSDTAALLQELTNSNKFNATRVSFLRERIGFEVRYGGYVAILVDGDSHFETGDPGVGANTTTWPCSMAGAATNCGTGDGLFCFGGQCSDLGQRTAVNARLFQAVLAAHLTTWTQGLPQLPLKLPVYLHPNVLPDGAARDPFFVGSFPLETQSNGTWRRFTAIEPTPDARIAHTLGRSGIGTDVHLLDPDPGVWFTIRNTTPPEKFRSGQENIPDLLRQYWAGLSLGPGEDGYLKKVLRGDSSVLNPNLGRFASVDEGLALQCDETIFDTCEVDETLDALKPYELTMTNVPEAFSGPIYTPVGLGFDYNQQAILDGFELLCEVSEGIESRTGCSANPPAFRSLRDLGKMGQHLKCLGDAITQQAALAVFPDFPESARDPMRRASANGTYETTGGTLGEELSGLKGALLQVASSGPVIGRTIRNFGEDMRALQETMNIFDVKGEMADIKFQSEAANQIANCLKETSSLIGVETAVKWGKVAAAAATCTNAAAQIHFADRLRDLGQEETQSERQVAVADFNKRFSDHVATLESEAIALAGALEGVSRQLSAIETARAAATRSLNKALWQLSTLNEGPVTQVLQRRKETSRIRYLRAHENAKRMAFLAKRAIEQRLGMRLADLREDLPLVPAPQTWEGTVCTTTGINFEALTTSAGPNNFADSFIGDYVNKLENVVESYRLRFNFHEGTDTAVVSLRDDVLRVRADCAVESPNLLYHASALENFSTSFDDTRPAWWLRGCDDAGVQRSDCVGIERHEDTPFFDEALDLRAVPSYELTFGTGWQQGARLVQRVALQPGRYRFSWYTPGDVASPGALAGRVRHEDGSLVGRVQFIDPLNQGLVTLGFIEGDQVTWNRVYEMFDLMEPTTVEVGFERDVSAPASATVAAAMLERLDGVPESSVLPRVFSNTTDSRDNVVPACEDTDGAVFRATRWDRGCVKLCPDGYSSDCGDARARTHCYRETSFHVTQAAMESGELFQQSGFALGNFNYRVESIGLNFVGTGVRDCSQSPLPSTCHAAGFVPYTLLHEGPYYVRNHRGEDFRAHLFTGRIEHARGLGTERYFSNPIGSADEDLIDSYLREEFQGRPLDGTFVLRVWEDEGVAFDAIEDVQLILNYRYWTRFE